MMFGQEMNTFSNFSRNDRNCDMYATYGRQRSVGTLEIHDTVHRSWKVSVLLA